MSDDFWERFEANALDPASKSDPQEASRATIIASDTGLPNRVVRRNMDEAEVVARKQRAKSVELTPTLADFVRDFKNAEQAHTDLAPLSDLERAVRFTGDIAVSPFEGALKGVGMAFEGAGRTYEIGRSWFERGLDKILPDAAMELLREPILPWWTDPGNVARWEGQGLKQVAADIGVPEERRNLATDISGAVGQMGAQIAMVLMNPAMGTAALFAQGVDQQGERVDQLNPNSLNFVDRYLNPDQYPVIENADGTVSTHKMAAEADAAGNWYVFPTIVQGGDGELKAFDTHPDAGWTSSVYECG